MNSTASMAVTIETHPAQDYIRDERVNRIMSVPRVSYLRANLNLDAIGVFHVSERSNGDLILLDGAHRDTALIEEGLGELDVTSVVYHGLSEAQEAKLFLLLNNRLSVDIIQRFRLSVTAQDPESVILDEVIRDAGFFPKSSGENALSCIVAVQSVYRGGSSTGRETHLQTIKDTLRIIAEGLGTDKSAIKETVRGIGGLLLNYGEDLDQEHLIKSLRELPTGVAAIRVRTAYHTREGGLSVRAGAEAALIEIYNKGVSPSQKIKV